MLGVALVVVAVVMVAEVVVAEVSLGGKGVTTTSDGHDPLVSPPSAAVGSAAAPLLTSLPASAEALALSRATM